MARAGLSIALFSAVGLAGAHPAAAAPPALTVTGTFDKPSYASGDEVSVKFSVHNSGTTATPKLSAQTDFGPTELDVDQDGFGVFDTGVSIPAGGTVTVTVSGHPRNLTATKVTLAGNLFDRGGRGVADFSFNAPVTLRTANASGLVFGDANSNGHADAGEGVSGVGLRLSYRYGDNRYSVTTAGGGRFSLVLPTASYYLTGAGNGWTVIPQLVTVGAGGSDLELRAVKPLGDVLKAEMHFTADSYAPGDTVHLVISLTNTGSATLRGIGAECDHVGDPDELNNVGPGWGALAVSGPGVTLPAHRTSTFDVTDKVPAAAQRAGQVVVECDFGYPEVDEGHRPTAGDTARVPGLFGALAGDVDYYPHGHGAPPVGLANVRVVLVDPTTCPVLTRTATTGSNGTFRIGGVPAGGRYQLYLYPPLGWKVRADNPTNVLVFGKDTVHLFIEVEHGSATVPSVPTTCGSSAPPTGPPLANTGADAAGLGAVGGAAILVGLLLLLCARPRTEPIRTT
jgi:hypothetical protein